jgi:hypothetical protein
VLEVADKRASRDLMADEHLRHKIETSENHEMMISPLERPSDLDTLGKGVRKGISNVASILIENGA